METQTGYEVENKMTKKYYKGGSNSPWFRKACAKADLRKPVFKPDFDDNLYDTQLDLRISVNRIKDEAKTRRQIEDES